jgi:hypothetical protein
MGYRERTGGIGDGAADPALRGRWSFNLGPNVTPGSTSSGRRVNEPNLEIIHKFKSKIMDIQQIEISRDLKTLTLSVRLTGESKPKNILVFDRE